MDLISKKQVLRPLCQCNFHFILLWNAFRKQKCSEKAIILLKAFNETINGNGIAWSDEKLLLFLPDVSATYCWFHFLPSYIPTYVQYLPMCNTYLCATPTLAAKTSLIDFQLDSLVIIIANSNEMGEDFNVFLGETTTDCSR